MRYIPNAPDERAQMLQAVGLAAAAELFRSIPADVRLNRPLDVAPAQSEMELLAGFHELAAKNTAARRPSFLGAGVYSHYSPTIVDALSQRSEFFTAYTPYQPEISQGTLQSIFEFQTLVCQLTGLDVANASMYDGSTGLAEAVLMAERVTRRKKVVASSLAHPEYLDVVSAYVQHYGVELTRLDFDKTTGQTAPAADVLDNHTAALVIQSPNFFGCVENLKEWADAAHAVGALLIVVVTEAISFGLLESPGACGADIVVAEGQSFGVPASFGGPHVGLFATRDKYVRQMPGRLVGEAYDQQGRRGFVLTLATREQHIRREKATSNICTNEGLIALAATIYLETMGRRGLQEVAYQNAQKAAYAAKRIAALDGYSLPYAAPRFNEFVVRGPRDATELLTRLASEHNITGGLALSRFYDGMPHDFLVCATETNSRAEIDALANGLQQISG
jgi:glycine dehydrogenase subunit 1